FFLDELILAIDLDDRNAIAATCPLFEHPLIEGFSQVGFRARAHGVSEGSVTVRIIVKKLTIASHLHMANNETYTCSPREVYLSNSNDELLIPTPWSDESKNEKRAKRWREDFEWKRSLFEIDLTFSINAFSLDKRTDVMKDKVSQEEEKVPLNNNIGKQIGDFVDMPSEAVEQRMDANVPDEIDGAKGKHVPNYVVKKGNLEFLICKEIANSGVNELVDKSRPLKRKRVYAE
nr:hypothetical protein [Tanacetum cinerariifolium]